MIERHVTFDVIPEKAKEFETFFVEEYRPAMAQTPGFIQASLLRAQEQPARYVMALRFDSPESAAAWRASEAHQALRPKLSAFHRGTTLVVFDVIA